MVPRRTPPPLKAGNAHINFLMIHASNLCVLNIKAVIQCRKKDHQSVPPPTLQPRLSHAEISGRLQYVCSNGFHLASLKFMPFGLYYKQ